MAFGAAAAYKTLRHSSEEDENWWALDSLQSYFLLGPDANLPLRLNVQRLSDGGRFAVRAVQIQQNDKMVCHVTCR